MPNNETSDQSVLLSIGELAHSAGVATATLRSWEARYGFPVPSHLPGGHRRYDADQVASVVEVARLRRAGRSVPAAIAAATETATPPARSFFASLRSGDRGLPSHVLRKPVLAALTSAIEDECLAQARRPVLVGAFQRARFYRQSEARWQELARTAERSVVFADFGAGQARTDHPAGHALDRPRDHSTNLPAEVSLSADSPVRREWALVCDAPGFTACVAGWELPSPPGTADADRRFETVWTLDPGVVRAATRVAIGLVHESDPALSETLAASLPEVAGPASPDLQRATSLFARILDYSQDAAGPPDLAS